MGHKLLWVACICALLIFPAQVETPNPFPARVVKVGDGDTVTVLTRQEEQVKIRLAEIDAPERSQPWADKSKQALAQLIFQKDVMVHPVTTDRFGRTVAHVFVGRVQVSRQLILEGHAWVYRKYLEDESLLDAEAEAQAAKRGLWNLPEYERIPPWEWRRKS